MEDRDTAAERRVEGKQEASKSLYSLEGIRGSAANPIVLDEPSEDKTMFEGPTAKNSVNPHEDEEDQGGLNDRRQLIVTFRYRKRPAPPGLESDNAEARYKPPPPHIDEPDPSYTIPPASPQKTPIRPLPEVQATTAPPWDSCDLVDWANRKLSSDLAKILVSKVSELECGEGPVTSRSTRQAAAEDQGLIKAAGHQDLDALCHRDELRQLKTAVERNIKELGGRIWDRLGEQERSFQEKFRVLEANGYNIVDTKINNLSLKVDAVASRISRLSELENRLVHLASLVEDLQRKQSNASVAGR
ncbi:hypothetical protein BDW74DRAFT_172871 [Aspergillus multicolor]|uniref:uncharacterized protein n=1 Tax=Aspergillus multicolor TaxID=41759 RepID=UPI003CCE15C7